MLNSVFRLLQDNHARSVEIPKNMDEAGNSAECPAFYTRVADSKCRFNGP